MIKWDDYKKILIERMSDMKPETEFWLYQIEGCMEEIDNIKNALSHEDRMRNACLSICVKEIIEERDKSHSDLRQIWVNDKRGVPKI